MKNTLIYILFSSFISLNAYAQNPQIKACINTGGQFHVINTNTDQFGFCQYGNALIDSISMLMFNSDHAKTLAVEAFEATAFDSVRNCEQVNGTEVSGTDADSDSFQLCFLADSSSIEMKTLRAGYRANVNKGLVQALKK